MPAQNRTIVIEYEGDALTDADELFLELVEVPECSPGAPQAVGKKLAAPLGVSTVIVTLVAWAVAKAALKLAVDKLENWHRARCGRSGDDPPVLEIVVLVDKTGSKRRYRLEPAERKGAAVAKLVFESVRTLIDEM
ncbi:MAG: hypothetical protein HQ567_07835 [Candidatus Nealsonbacteria bacterium]|nr:hypothetical protein [Candidatus Nealsonbacteria bacterium]